MEHTEPLEPPQHCGRTKPHLPHETVIGDCAGHTGPPRDVPLPLLDRFTYHPPEPEQIPIYGMVRDAGYQLALTIEAVSKPSREQARALDSIDRVVMETNAAIARHGLADPAYAGAAEVIDLVTQQMMQTKPDSVLVAPFADAPMWSALALVAGERSKQVEELGYTHDHDDTQGLEALCNYAVRYVGDATRHMLNSGGTVRAAASLVKAAAVLVAALEHLEREADRRG